VKDKHSWLDFPVVESKGRISIIGSLRGYAALAVLLCHASELLTDFNLIAHVFSYGQMGVVMFFVISGVVMPWSLHAMAYKTKDIFRFLAQRSVRIDVPYYFIIAITLLYYWIITLRPGFAGNPFHFDWIRTVLHLGYLIPFSTTYTWYNNAFWTLAIEFQYYVLLGLSFQLLQRFKWSQPLMLVLLALIGFWQFSNNDLFIFRYQGLFVMGIVLYQLFNGLIDLKTGIAVVLLETVLVGFQYHWVAAGTGLLSFFLVLRFHNYQLPGVFLGKISYSLYLVHPLVISVLFSLFRRLPTGALWGITYFCLTIIISVLAAWILWRFVEVPALNWSHSIKEWFKKNKSISSASH